MVDGSLTGPVIGVKLTIQATGERVECRCAGGGELGEKQRPLENASA